MHMSICNLTIHQIDKNPTYRLGGVGATINYMHLLLQAIMQVLLLRFCKTFNRMQLKNFGMQ